ncbi:MAG: VOC family protein [Promethearchaeota archaeon]|jgi:catechol 2,3-dioxygenase-like lactoylglutathione lyase family enzyme
MPVVQQEKSPILTFVTEDVDDFYNKLIRLGIEIRDKPKTNKKFAIYHFFFKDPNGYTIEIQKFLA